MAGALREVIRPSTIDDVDGLRRLFEEAFPGQSRSAEIWRWKYFAHPRGPHTYLCEVDGRIVAHCGGTEVTMADGDRRYRSLQSVDFMSSPSYPGGLGRGGVFARTVDAFFAEYCGRDRIAMVYGFPGERHRIFGERVLGYRAIEKVGELVLDSIGATSFDDLGELDTDGLDLISKTHSGFGAVRDLDYLRWRYRDHPETAYRSLTVPRRLFSREWTTAILCRDDDRIRVMELGGRLDRRGLTALTEELKRLDRPVVFWVSGRHPIGRLLASLGLETRERDHHIECRYFFDRPHPAPGDIYYSTGDYDVW